MARGYGISSRCYNSLFLVTKNAFEKKNLFLLKPQQNSQEITQFAQKYPFSG